MRKRQATDFKTMEDSGDDFEGGADRWDTSAEAKKELLKGPEGCWVTCRRNNWCYFLNKFVSICIAGGFAAITMYLKL